MSHDALVACFDRHLVRFEEELRLNREANAQHAAMYDDQREFIREMTLRMHRDSAAMVDALNAITTTMHEDLVDGREQLKTNTAAVLAMLDRLSGGR